MPPQAYTRDTLVKAIEWVSSQPSAVREKANSADLIVSMYLSARRKTAAAETASAQESFKLDLKHMAEDLKQAEDPSPPTPNRSPAHGGSETQVTTVTPVAPVAPVAPVTNSPAPAPSRFPSPMRPPEHRAVPAVQWTVDERSLELAREVQERFNLGHESEALRMLIQLGSQRMRDFFP